MNPIIRLYRHFFPVKPLSCFALGILKAIKEQRPRAYSEPDSSSDFYKLMLAGETVVIKSYFLNNSKIGVRIKGSVIILPPHEGRAIKDSIWTITNELGIEDENAIKAKQAPIIQAIEKIGCPENVHEST